MKKIFLSITTLLLIASVVHAQNGSPYWSLAGNSNATSSSKLGTTNGTNLRFFTNNFERARINTSGLFGIGTTSPNAKLHISSPSGTNAIRAQVGGSTKFLVHYNGGLSVGSSSTPPSNGLYVSGNVGIGTNSPSYKLHVVGNASVTNGLYVGDGGIFGYNSGGAGVYGSGSSYGLYGTSTGTYGVYGLGGTYGVYGEGSSFGVYGISTSGYGVRGFSTNSYGVYGSSSNSYGVYGNGVTGVYANGSTYGLYATTSSGYGVSGISSSSVGVYGSGYYGLYGAGSTYGAYVTGNSYGLYGYSSSGWGVSGVSSSNRGVYGASSSGIAGYFISTSSHGIWAKTSSTASDVYAGVFEGKVYTYNSYVTSDKNLKTEISDFGDAISIIKKLKPKHFLFRNDGKFASLNLPSGDQIGLLAQDVEQVLPNIVADAPLTININTKPHQEPKLINPAANGVPARISDQTVKTEETTEILKTKAVNYTALIPVLIKAMQEQQTTIEKLKATIEELTLRVNNLSHGNPSQAGVKFFGSLDGASPNPATNMTRISYSLAPNFTRAELVVYDAEGKKVDQMQLNKSGVIDINILRFSSGVYTYSLFVNSILVGTQKLVVTKP